MRTYTANEVTILRKVKGGALLSHGSEVDLAVQLQGLGLLTEIEGPLGGPFHTLITEDGRQAIKDHVAVLVPATSNSFVSPSPGEPVQPIDDTLVPGQCNCEFVRAPDDPPDDEPWLFLRRCQFCNKTWYGLHCPHDGMQNVCPNCRVKPKRVDL